MSWLREYESWAGRCTDAPAVFHKWGAYMALSSALGRRVRFQFGPVEMTTNLYVLLLAPSSAFRKSTALSLSRRIAARAGAHALAADGSPEGFIEELTGHPEGTLYYSELAQFDRERFASFKPLLSELYDAPAAWRRKLSRGELTLNSPCVSVFAASAPDFVFDRLMESELGGPLLSRFILVSAASKEQRLAIPPAADAEAEERLAGRLREIREGAAGLATFDAVRAPYERWTAAFEGRTRTPLFDSFACRQQVSCLKLAVLEQLAEDGTLAVTEGALERAIAAIESASAVAAQMEDLDMGCGRDRESRELRAVSRLVQAAGKMELTALMRKTRLTASRLSRALETLRAYGRIRIEHEYPKDGGRALRRISWQVCAEDR